MSARSRKTGPLLAPYHRRLLAHYGPLGWWPAESPFEVMVGAILTQNTAWRNVELALGNLRGEGLLSVEAIRALPRERLAALIRPAGYYNVKAKRLGNFVEALAGEFGGDLEAFFATPTDELRRRLLSINGIGKETADSILCYAADREVFVVDAYTRRILSRHGLTPAEIGYDELQRFCEAHLPRSLEVYNEFHAEIVHVGKDHCRPTPRCEGCPLEGLLPAKPRR